MPSDGAKSTRMKIHPAANLFREMTDEELTALAADIKENGLLDPIDVDDQQRIIDGRSRYKACKMVGVEPSFVTIRGDLPVVRYVIGKNLHRRHLTQSQRVAAAAEALPLLEKEAADRKRQAGREAGRKGGKIAGQGRPKNRGVGKSARTPTKPDHRARDDAAAIFGASGRGVQDAKAVKQADPQLFEEVKSGAITLPQAKRKVQREAKRKTLKAKARKAAAAGKPEWHLIEGDCLVELPKITEARLIFADPPYNIGVDYGMGATADSLAPEQYVVWCREWLRRCTDCLTKDGSLWVMISDDWAAEFALIMDDLGLSRRAWIKWYETFGNNCANNFNRCSRHILYYVADPKHFVFNRDAITRPSDRHAKYNDSRADPGGKIWDDVWQIPRLTDNASERLPDFPTQLPMAITRAIVGCASDPGDLVLDPFCGSGSTGHAALELGRRFTGIELMDDFCEPARLRLAAV